jgi:hypothetical protein
VTHGTHSAAREKEREREREISSEREQLTPSEQLRAAFSVLLFAALAERSTHHGVTHVVDFNHVGSSR